jgi:hypothetical protein
MNLCSSARGSRKQILKYIAPESILKNRIWGVIILVFIHTLMKLKRSGVIMLSNAPPTTKNKPKLSPSRIPMKTRSK